MTMIGAESAIPSAEYKPGLVAVPDGRHRVHRLVSVPLTLDEEEYDADTQIESVENNLGQNDKRD